MAVTFQRNVGMLLLAIWLILYGLPAFPIERQRLVDVLWTHADQVNAELVTFLA